MLIELQCDKFMSYGKPRPPIKFHKGLNAILGSDDGKNSIGKSTFMMILDFAFGGRDYVIKSTDVQEQVGFHEIKFALVFDDKPHYFSRNTAELNSVNCCDSDYNQINTISLSDYCDLLFEQYKISLKHIGFRNMVSGFIRVANRDNYNSHKPLAQGFPESGEKTVDRLLKMFGEYEHLANIKELEKIQQEQLDVLNGAKKHGFIPIITKTQYSANKNEMDILSGRKKILLEKINTEQLKFLGIQADTADETLALKNKLSSARRQRSKLRSQLIAIENNIKQSKIQSKNNYLELIDFFPGINIKQLNDIAAFHEQLREILHDEFNEEVKQIEEMLSVLGDEISTYEKELSQIGSRAEISKTILENYSEIDGRLKEITNQNEEFDRFAYLNNNVKGLKEQIKALLPESLSSLQNEINIKMRALNDFIFDGLKKSPVFNIKDSGKGYDFHTPDDTGTGTSFKSLVVFDLSIMDLTNLPMIIHDSVVLKQIEDHAIERIMELYSNSGNKNKQVFIALDKGRSYTKKTQSLLEESSVLELSYDGNELFGRSWNEMR